MGRAEGFGGRETALCETAVVCTRVCTLVQTHAVGTTKSEPARKLRTSADTGVSMWVHQL